jgi:hypothetical protein
VALSLTFTAPLGAAAENSAPYSFDTCSAQKQCRQLSRAELGRLRGGLSYMGADSAIQLTFGITQVVYVNDELVALTQLLLPAVNQALGAGTSSAPQMQILNSAPPSGQATPPPTSVSAAPAVGARTSAAQAAPTGIAKAPPPGAGPAQATAPTTMAANTTNTAPSSSTASAANGPTAPTVFVNGVQATPTNPVVLNVPTADQLKALVVQNGAGNSVPNAAELRAATMATVIQNTLDNQTIRALTIFNVSVALSEAKRAMDIGNAVRNSLK